MHFFDSAAKNWGTVPWSHLAMTVWFLIALVIGISFVSRRRLLHALAGLAVIAVVSLADWVLALPFRSDIVALAPQQTKKLGRAHFEPGDVVVRQGDKGDCAYLIRGGELEVLQQDGDRQQRVAKLQSGDCFGEIALLADVPRTATVRCLTPVDVLVLPRDEFMTLAEGYRDFGSALRSRMMERMGEPPLVESQPRATGAG